MPDGAADKKKKVSNWNLSVLARNSRLKPSSKNAADARTRATGGGFPAPPLSALKASGDRYAAQAAQWDAGGMTDRWANGVGRANAASAALGPDYVDPFGGANALDALTYGQGGGGSGGGSGGRRGGGGGGGGGGGSAGADAAALDAYGAEGLAAMRAAYEQQLAALLAQEQAAGAGYDQRTSALGSMRDQGDARLAAIQGELTRGANDTRGYIAGAYDQGDARLAALQAEYMQMNDAQDQGANRTLQAFGANPVGPSGANVGNLVGAARTQNNQLRTINDASLANRSNVYNALGSDVRTQSGQSFDVLMAKLLADRQASGATLAEKRAQAAQAQAQAEAQFQLQLAAQKAGLK